jgi:hypothetical protein
MPVRSATRRLRTSWTGCSIDFPLRLIAAWSIQVLILVCDFSLSERRSLLRRLMAPLKTRELAVAENQRHRPYVLYFQQKMNKIVEQFAAQLNSPESQTLADLRDFVDWQTQAQGRMFIPQTVDDVAIRSHLLHLRLSRVSRSIVQRTIESLKPLLRLGPSQPSNRQVPL